MNVVKRFITHAARSFGYAIIPTWQNHIIIPPSQEHTFPAARFMRRLLKFLKVDCILDVGANRGQYLDFLRQEVGYSGIIVSFEPILANVESLRFSTQKDKRVYVEHCALGSTPGMRKFNVMVESQFSSFLDPSHEEVTLFDDQNKIKETLDVQVKTLDEVVTEILQKFSVNSLYLKLDTQGFELEILRGGEHTLPTIKALQFEASVRTIYHDAPKYDEVIKFCEQHGFLMSGIYPNNAGHFPLLVEFDCYLINQKCGPTWLTSQASQV